LTTAQRALATRRRIRLAAERLFLRDGYLPTTMTKIAAEAGVAEKTVYLAFPTKADLLNEIIRIGVRGDEGSTPVSQREEWREMRASRSVDLLLHHAASRNAARCTGRTLPCPRRGERRDRSTAGGTARPRASKHPVGHARPRDRARGDPRIDPDRLAETLFAFAANESPYLRLTEECDWPEQQYASAIRAILAALVDHATS